MKQKRNNRINFGAVASAHTFVHACSHVHLSLIPVLMIEFQLTLLATSIIATVPYFFQIFGGIFSGMFSDKTGPYNMVAISLLFSGIGAIIAGVASEQWILILSFSLLSLASSIYHPPAYSITSKMDKENTGTILGILGSTGVFGVAIGPITVGLLLTSIGWRSTYLMWSIPILSLAILILVLRLDKKNRENSTQINEEKEIDEEKGSLRNNHDLIAVLATTSLISMGRICATTYFTVYLVVSQGISESTSIVLVGVMSLAGIISAASGGYFADKYGNKRWLTLIYGIMVIFLLLFTYAEGIRTVTGIAIIYGFVRTMDMGASASLIAEVSTDKRRSKAYGMYFLPVYVLGAFIPILAAYVAEQTDISSVFILASIFMFLGVIVLQKVSSEKKVKNKDLKEK